jgi:uncharacterized tellurite resistance protein B-like protein
VNLLEKLREHLAKRRPLARDRKGAPADLELQAATSILLLEAAYGDTDYVWREHKTIVKGLEREFGLGRKEILSVLDRADEIRPPVVKLADVTSVICDRFSVAQREEIVRLLWRVIEADQNVEEWEQVFGDHVAKAVGLTCEQARAARAASRA